ncbi:hypothetical protein OESDEN_04516 [Oesophagostomum dentatum]|uniref:C2H2-type domain-containing protein n=1 Tax=Oesophagostomum dentatum TaxID=61180 RepID=A0A0B1TI94_OESDE|nr:hypothetical protein OESDEN_04516 [Oesophagostomum dentatum]
MDVPILMEEARTLDLNGIVNNAANKTTSTHESSTSQSVRQTKSAETVIKDEALFESRDSKDSTLSITSASLLDAHKDSGDEIFNDSAQECEASGELYNSSARNVRMTFANRHLMLHKRDIEAACQAESCLSAEGSQADGIHALKLICSNSRPSATAEVIGEGDANESQFLQDHDDDEGGLDIEPGSSHMFTDLGFDESDLLYGNKLLDFHESMIEQGASSLVREIEAKHKKRLHSRPRPSTSKEHTPHSTDHGSTQQGECRVEKKFLCKYPRCDVKVSWRPRYGKNRLVDHVRIHWGKKVKKCPSCDYVATHQRKILYHHKMFHRDVTFTGVVSLETKEDMEELLRLWKQCFPDAVLDEFCDSNVARIQRARPALPVHHQES